jgi:formylmethanofuran dehydrogenase subunit C
MVDEVAKSLKLNRNLSNNLSKAIELDRAIKIGWGAQGDAKPKEGEIGIAPHLPPGARVRLLGNLGDFTAFCCNGGTFTLEGNALGWFGAFSSDGRLVVERDAGFRCGHGMSGGRLFCQGSVGDEAGAALNGGTIIVRGHAGQRTGIGMEDGTIVVVGDCKGDAGQGMTGGRIIVDGRCLPEGDGALQRGLTKAEHKEINGLLKEHDLTVSEDAVVIEADASSAIPAKSPDQTVWGDFGEIGLISGEIPIDASSPIDVVTLLTRGEEDEGVVFPLPVLLELENGKGLTGSLLSEQPCLVDSGPRGIDLVRIGKGNVSSADELLPHAAGVVLDLDDLPPLNDGEILALMTGLRSHLGDEKPVLIAGRVDRVTNLHRMLNDQPIDGVLVRLTSGVGMAAPAALPRIGLSARDAGVSDTLHVLDIPWDATADDAAIAAAAGCGIIRVNPFAIEEETPGTQKARAEAVENWLNEFAATLRGRLTDMGVDALEKLNRRHLRALEHDTAAQSGLRLAGYDRPLPQWMGQ